VQRGGISNQKEEGGAFEKVEFDQARLPRRKNILLLVYLVVLVVCCCKGSKSNKGSQRP
jgi:hypothetical protein